MLVLPGFRSSPGCAVQGALSCFSLPHISPEGRTRYCGSYCRICTRPLSSPVADLGVVALGFTIHRLLRLYSVAKSRPFGRVLLGEKILTQNTRRGFELGFAVWKSNALSQLHCISRFGHCVAVRGRGHFSFKRCLTNFGHFLCINRILYGGVTCVQIK